MTKQLEIDFTRCVRLKWIEKLIVPAYEREFSDGAIQKARTAPIKVLLRVLESHARDGGSCRLKRSTIATEMGVSERTASRVIGDAEQLGVVQVLKRSLTKLTASEYAINWTTLKEWLLENPTTARLVDENAPLTGYEEPAVRRIQFVMEERLAEAAAVVESEEDGTASMGVVPFTDESEYVNSEDHAHTGRATQEEEVGVKRGGQAPFPKTEKEPDPDADKTFSPGTTCHSPGTNEISPGTTLQSPGTSLQVETTERTIYSRTRVLKPCINHDETFFESSDVSNSVSQENGNLRNDGSCYGWPYLIQKSHLQKMSSLLELWKHALRTNWGLRETDRQRFFTLATSIVRKHTEHRIRDCGASFTTQLRESIKTGIWPGNSADEQVACNSLKVLDRVQRDQLRAAGAR